MDIHVYVHDFASNQKLDQILSGIKLILEKEKQMAGELDALKAQVAKNGDVEASAVALLQGLKVALDAAIAAGDPAALTALSTQLGQQTDALAAAVVANTPAA